jgi:voltage-gated potassium channel
LTGGGEIDLRSALKFFVLKYRSEILLCSLIAQILVSPLADRSPHIGGLLAFIEMLSVLAGASYMADRRIIRLIVLPVGAIWFIARLVEALGDSRHAYMHFAPVTGLVFSCAILWALLARVQSTSRVKSSVISEAFIIYLIIAIAFSQLYWILDHLLGNPFKKTIPFGQSSTFLYFSMTTLSGLGYSDIIPENPYIRLLAGIENTIGIFYIAVVVARLISSYRARTGEDGDGPHGPEI